MKAAVWTEIDKIEIMEVATPVPKSGEVLLKVISAGLCITDLHVYTGQFVYGKPPQILGHEISGEIVELGSNVDDWKIGDRVVVETSIGCGKCESCKKGERHFCNSGSEIGFTPNQGGYAQFISVPAINLFKVPDNVSFDESGIIESVVCPVGGLFRLGVKFGETVAVFGVGPAGLAFIQAAKTMGAGKVIAIARDDKKLEVAKSFGADYVINNKKSNVIESIRQITKGEMVSTVCEAAGVSQTISDCFDIVCKGGRVLLYGIPGDKEKFDFPIIKIITNQIEIQGIVGNPFVWESLLEAVSSGKINLRKMITHTFPLDKINDAFKLLADKSEHVIKIVIKPWE